MKTVVAEIYFHTRKIEVPVDYDDDKDEIERKAFNMAVGCTDEDVNFVEIKGE